MVEPSGQTPAIDPVAIRLANMERLRGPLRIVVRHTDDGLGIAIPPSRNIAIVAFLLLWLGGWAMGEAFALGELFSGPWPARIFMIIWIIPWTLGGLGVMWVILWQLFGREQLFFTGGALVREWSLLGFSRRRVVMGESIRAIRVAEGAGNDLAGLGTIKVETETGTMQIGSGLSRDEADFIADLIRTVGGLSERSQSKGQDTDG